MSTTILKTEPSLVHLEIIRGAAFLAEFNFADANGDTKDLTGWTAYAEARCLPSSDLAFDLAPAIPDPTSGKVRIAYTSEESSDLAEGRYGWDLFLEDPDGARSGPHAAGRCNVKTPHTQP